MNFNKHFTEELELDPSEINKEQEFLKITEVEPDKNGHIYLDVEVEYSGSFESSGCFGTWEDSHEEFSLEVDGIYFAGTSVERFLSEKIKEELRQKAIEKWAE